MHRAGARGQIEVDHLDSCVMGSAVIGKALAPLPNGCGLVPMIVALQ
jgi:hypothetical protein